MCITPHCWKNFTDRLTRFQLRRAFLYTIPIMIRHIMKPPFYGIFLLLWRHDFVNINNTFRADKCPYQILLFWVSFLSFHLQKNDYHYPKYEAIELVYWIYLSFLVRSIKMISNSCREVFGYYNDISSVLRFIITAFIDD